MNQLNDRQIRLFTRTIMPELYAMQDRQNKRTKGYLGGVKAASVVEVMELYFPDWGQREVPEPNAKAEKPVS